MAYDAELAAADFRRFASWHQLSYATGATIPPVTFALMQSESKAHSIVAGELPGGLDGLVADFGHPVKSAGQEQQDEHHSLVLLTRVPESVGFIPSLICQDSSGHRLVDLIAGPGFRTVEFESLRLNQRYRVAVYRSQDENWLRQLFDPVFIDWLASDAPEGCFFELMKGVLCASSAEEPGTPDAIERLCAVGARVAERLRSEVGEQEGLGMFLPPPMPSLQRARKAFDHKVDQVKFKSPPLDVRTAAKRYRPLAWRRLRSWIFVFVLCSIVLVLPAGFIGAFAGGFFKLSGSDGLSIAAAAFLVGLLLMYPFFIRAVVRSEATLWGFEAFARAYGVSRGLEDVDPFRYHAEHARLRLPGLAFKVLSGTLTAGAGEGTLVVCRDQGRRVNLLTAALAAVTRVGATSPLPVISVAPRGAKEGYTALGGFLLEDVTGLERVDRTPRSDYASLSQRFDVTVDELANPEDVRRLMSPDFVSWLTARADDCGLGFALDGADVVAFTAESKVVDWSAADLDGLCADLARIRGAAAKSVDPSAMTR